MEVLLTLGGRGPGEARASVVEGVGQGQAWTGLPKVTVTLDMPLPASLCWVALPDPSSLSCVHWAPAALPSNPL